MASFARGTAAALLLLIAGCITPHNYMTIDGPRYSAAAPLWDRPAPDTIRIVSFNIQYAIRVDSAISVLALDPVLKRADVVLLQEMDAAGTQRIAGVLDMGYVYYPATRHFKHDRDFGNAVLSRWPIVADRKLVLPHLARVAGTARGATAATIRFGTEDVRFYSTHLGTIANVSNGQRRDQLRTILEDAAQYDRVVIGGDMNDGGVGSVAVEKGYAWPTREGPRTAAIGRLDHIFVKGLQMPDNAAAGTVLENRNSSDHRPIWAVVLLR